MDCEKAQMLLAQMAFAELETASEEGRELSAHLAGCRVCTERLREMRVAAKLLREGVESGPAPVLSPERRTALMAAAATPRAPKKSAATRRRWPTGSKYALHAAAGVLVVVGVLMIPATFSVRRRAEQPNDAPGLTKGPGKPSAACADARSEGLETQRRGPGREHYRPEIFARPKLRIDPQPPVTPPPPTIYHEKPKGDMFTSAKVDEKDLLRIEGKKFNFKGYKDTDERTARRRGREDAISDIPLGGTGTTASMGVVGGGMAGVFGKRAKAPPMRDLSNELALAPDRTPVVRPRPAPPRPDYRQQAEWLTKELAKAEERPTETDPKPETKPGKRPMVVHEKRMAELEKLERLDAIEKGKDGKDLKYARLPFPGPELGLSSETRETRKKKIAEIAKKPAAGRRARFGYPHATVTSGRMVTAPAYDLSASPRMRSALAMLKGKDKKQHKKQQTSDDFRPEGPREGSEPAQYVKLTPREAEKVEGREAKAAEPKVEKIKEEPEPAGEAVTERGAIFKIVPVNPFVMTGVDRFSTFGIDVDTASYSIARRYIRGGYLPPIGSVRMEEFVNAFDYNYPRKTRGTFTVISEAAPSPFGRGLVLLKVGVRGRVVGREGRKQAHLVFVVDASGSMDQPDRMPLVKFALKSLVGQLRSTDRVSLVSYGTKARLVLEAVGAAEKTKIASAIDAVQCGGSTNLLDGLTLGYQMAARAFRSGGINRVILCSDGAANIGLTKGREIVDEVKTFRDQGITFTSVGFGTGTYNDVLLEKLANSGDGSYVFVDSKREARRVFVEEMAATLQTIAKDVKIQVKFDPRRVRRYRLIGYENRDIEDAKFRDDTVDAGEVGSGQSATALYELELHGPAGRRSTGDIGTVYVRYRDPDTGRVEEISHRLERSAIRRRTPKTAPRFFLAACAAEFAELLRASEHASGGSFDALRYTLEKVAVQPALRRDSRVRELLQLVRRAKGLPRAK